MKRPATLLLLQAFLPLAGCLSPGSAPDIHYYSAETDTVDVGRTSRTAPSAVRLRRVSSAGHLKERVVWHASDVERGFYDLRRWTEPPLAYLERGFARELFERLGYARSELSSTTAVDLELVAFDEVREPTREAHVAFTVRVTSGAGESLLDRTVERRVPVESDGMDALARAMKRALAEAVAEGAVAVARMLD